MTEKTCPPTCKCVNCTCDPCNCWFLPLNSYNTGRRFYGLDALRALAMLLGIVLHASLPYVVFDIPGWASDKSDSEIITLIFQFIHLWRMPVFFILSGFFSNLLITRHGWIYWWKNRGLRILLPLIIFSPLMIATIPWIFKYSKIWIFLFLWRLSSSLMVSLALSNISYFFIYS